MTTMILRHMHLSKWEQENLEGKAYKSRIVEPILSFESVLLRSAGDPDLPFFGLPVSASVFIRTRGGG
jgi:hypothetical protein